MRFVIILSMLVGVGGACKKSGTSSPDITVYKNDKPIANGFVLTDANPAPEEFARVSYLVLRWQPVCEAHAALKKGKRGRWRVKRALREIESVLLEHERTPWMTPYEVVCAAVTAHRR